MAPATTKDCVIIGGGPAGLTAALYLARFVRSVMVIDALDGRSGLIPKTHDLPPFPAEISGPHLLDLIRQTAAMYGAILESGTVRSVQKLGEVFHIATDNRTETERTIILATGFFNHRPPVFGGPRAGTDARADPVLSSVRCL